MVALHHARRRSPYSYLLAGSASEVAAKAARSSEKCIVLTMAGRVVGAVVDGVSDVVNLAPEQVRQPPELGCSLDTEYVRGLGIVAERMLILLDIEKLMSGPGMALAHAT